MIFSNQEGRVKTALGSLALNRKKSRFRKRSLPIFGSAVNSSEQKNCLQRDIDATDHQIEQLVYGLCGLMEDGSELTAKPGI